VDENHGSLAGPRDAPAKVQVVCVKK
jgi:hypothetical protein